MINSGRALIFPKPDLFALCILAITCQSGDAVFSSVNLDFLWYPANANGSNITEYVCPCFHFMDHSNGRCLASSIISREEAMNKEIDETPLLNPSQCLYKRVILGQRVKIRCPYSRNDSRWTSLGRWNYTTDVCVESDPVDGSSSVCSRRDHLVLTSSNELIIDPVMPVDPGIYECTKLGRTSYYEEEVFRMGLVIDYDTGLYGQLVYSSIVGAAAALAFLAIALGAHFLRVLIEYCRKQEMNKHVQWVIEFVSRQHHLPPHHHPSMRARYYPPNTATIITSTISEEPEIKFETSEGLPDVIIVDGKGAESDGSNRLPVRNWGPYMPVRMEQLAAIRDRANQQMERVRARYYERAQRVRTQCGAQMDQLHQRYHSKLSRVKDYSSNRYYKVRVKYYKKRQDLQNYANMKMSLIRDNYLMQRQYLSKVMDSLAIDSCRSYAPSFIAGSEDYQSSLHAGDSIAAGLDLDSLAEDGTSSLASSKRGIPPPVDEDDDSVNIILDWECLTPPDLPPPPKSKTPAAGTTGLENEGPASAPDSPVLATKSGKLAGCLIPCHSAVHQHSHHIPPQLLRCSAYQAGICVDGRHFQGAKLPINGSLKKPVKKDTSSSPVSSSGNKTSSNDIRVIKSEIVDSEAHEQLLSSDAKSSSDPILTETLKSVEDSLPFADD